MEYGPELTPEEEALWDMSDEELEAAVAASRDAEQVEDIAEEYEEENTEDEVVDTEDDVEDDEVSDEDPEQPETDEDSTEEDSDNEDADDDGDEVVEDDSDDADAAETEDDEQPEETKEEPKEEAKIETFKVKANGMDFDFTAEELVKLAPKAMDYTKKMQEIAPYRKMISAITDNGYSQDDVNLMIDVLKGDKDAITSVIKKAGIDTLDIDTEKELEYAPREYGKSDIELNIADVESRIANDKEYVITRDVVNRQWDEASQEVLVKNPDMIEGLHRDIQNGIYDKVAPAAMKKKVLDGGRKSDLEYYLEAGKEVLMAEQSAKNAEAENAKLAEQQAAEKAAEEARKQEELLAAKSRQEKQKSVKAKAKGRKAAATTKSNSGNNKITDYLDDNDEAFDEWYKNLQASQ